MHVFDGQNWTYRQMVFGKTDPKVSTAPLVRTEADGLGVLVFARSENSLWRWRNSQWALIPTSIKDIQDIVPWQSGTALAFTLSGEVFSIPLDGKARSILSKSKSAPGATIGDIHLGKTRLLAVDYAGTLYMAAQDAEVESGLYRGGLLVAQPKGSVRFLGDAGGLTGWEYDSPGSPGVLLTADGKGLWLPSPTRLLDLRDGKVTGSPWQPLLFWLQAVKADGTLFLSPPPSYPCFIMAYTPGGANPPTALESIPVKVERGVREVFGVAPDGSIWVQDNGLGIVRFDGKRWTLRQDSHSWDNPTTFHAGQNGEAMFVHSRICDFHNTKGDIESGEPHSILQRHREEIAKAFPEGIRARFSLAPDNQGNLWLCQGSHLGVLIGDKWIGADQALEKAGARLGMVKYLARLGSGSKVFASDSPFATQDASSFVGEVKDGQLVFTPLPNVTEGRLIQSDFRAADGALWLTLGKVRPGTPGEIEESGIAVRLTEDGVTCELHHQGAPIFSDANGNVWLAGADQQPKDTFSIWRGGKVAGSVTVPTGDEHTAFVSDKPGSVYAAARFGIYHLAASATNPAEYNIVKVYTLDGKPQYDHFAYSKLGYLVLYEGGLLKIIPMPK